MLLVFACLAGLARGAAESSELFAIKDAYTTRRNQIHEQYAADCKGAADWYDALLARSIADLEKRGSLESMLELMNEQKRFAESGRQVPAVSPTGLLSGLVSAQAHYRQLLATAAQTKRTELDRAGAAFLKQVDQVKRKLTTEGRIEDALVAREDGKAFALRMGVLTADATPDMAGEGGPSGPSSPCPACNGSGKSAVACKTCAGSQSCATCRGTGRLAGLRGSNNTRMCVTCKGTGQRSCPECGGDGMRDADCQDCEGSGKIPSGSRGPDAPGGRTAPAGAPPQSAPIRAPRN